MNQIALAGCTATPLAGYLKALGVLRLLSTADQTARGFWRGDHMVIQVQWPQQTVEDFFLTHYQPTPIIAPWNGGSGFYKKDNKKALQAIVESKDPRLSSYRECLLTAEVALGDIDRSASPKDELKAALLKRLRALLPDPALDWLDAAVMLSRDVALYPPLLGTGGNDGRLDFTNNFMQHVTEVLGLTDDSSPSESVNWLRMALFGQASPGLLKKAIGQFSPGQVGGPNSTIGFEGESTVNPWEFILMFEGALTFAAASARRDADDRDGSLSYPFTVRAVGAGAGSLGEGDAASARGELWLPLWGRPTTYPEVRALLAEGRVTLGRKPARDALDFVRAVHQLGGYRGIESFQRYGLLERSGKAYLATPLARVNVTPNAQARWLDDLDTHGWLTRFRRFAQGDNVAKQFLTLRRRLEDAMFDVAGRRPTPVDVQALLILLSEIDGSVALSRKARDHVPPVPRLPEQWTQAADDGSPSYRIARGLAGLRGGKDFLLPLRAQLSPVHPKLNIWMDVARQAPDAARDPFCRLNLQAERASNLPLTLIALLQRRLLISEMLQADRPLDSSSPVAVDDLLAFLQHDRMDNRIDALLRGLALCDITVTSQQTSGETVTPAAFALLKLCMTPTSILRKLKFIDDENRLPSTPELLTQLSAGNIENRAVRAAWRRLRASGMAVSFGQETLPELIGIAPSRAAAALLLPLSFGVVGMLGRLVLEGHIELQ